MTSPHAEEVLQMVRDRLQHDRHPADPPRELHRPPIDPAQFDDAE